MKAKSRSTAKKRFRVTGTGKIKVNKAGRKHLLQQKSLRQKKAGKVGRGCFIEDNFKYQIKKALPYLGC